MTIIEQMAIFVYLQVGLGIASSHWHLTPRQDRRAWAWLVVLMFWPVLVGYGWGEHQ